MNSIKQLRLKVPIMLPVRTVSTPSIVSEHFTNLNGHRTLSVPSLPSRLPTSSESSTQIDVPFGKRTSAPLLSHEISTPHHLPRAVSYPMLSHDKTYRTVYQGHGNILDDKFLKEKYPSMNPNDICCIKIPRCNITFLNAIELEKYENVVYIDAGENKCSIESFRVFRDLIELNLPLNDISAISIPPGHFTKLRILDLQCNNLLPTAVKSLGYLPSLRALNISSNNLEEFPVVLNPTSFINLEILILDNNKLSNPMWLVVIARIPRLKILSMEKNNIKTIPYIDTRATVDSVKRFITEWNVLNKSQVKQMKHRSLDSFKSTSKSKEQIEISERLSSRILDEMPKESSKQSVKKNAKGSNSSQFYKLPPLYNIYGIVYLVDQGNHKEPFVNLEQISLAGNKIKEVRDVQAVKTWRKLKNIVLIDNPVSRLSSRRLAPLKCYLVPEITKWPLRVLDPSLDPFYMKDLISRFLHVEIEMGKQCLCHKLEPENKMETHVFPTLDLLNSHPMPSKNFPLPSIRLCQFHKFIESYFSQTPSTYHYHKTDYISHSFPHCYHLEAKEPFTSVSGESQS